jgi:hypothetical protein
MTTPIDPSQSRLSFQRLDRFIEDRAIEGVRSAQSTGQRYGNGKTLSRPKTADASEEESPQHASDTPVHKNATDGNSVDYYA